MTNNGPLGFGILPTSGPIRRALGVTPEIDRNEAIRRIRDGLKARSGKPWSVTGGKGTAWGWITITAPPQRRGPHGEMTEADRAELGDLLALKRPADRHAEQVPASREYRQEYVDRAEGREPTVIGTPYWD